MLRVTEVRNELGPLLDALILQLQREGRATQSAYYHRIRARLLHAHDELALVQPIFELSTGRTIGFEFSVEGDALIDRILQKAALLVHDMEAVRAGPVQ